MPHVDDGALHAYLDGELTPAERTAVEAHVAECPSCRARLDEERALIARASELLGLAGPEERPAPPLHQLGHPRLAWRLRMPLAWAASVVLALAVGYHMGGTSFMAVPRSSEPDLGSFAAEPAADSDAARPRDLPVETAARRLAPEPHRARSEARPAAPLPDELAGRAAVNAREPAAPVLARDTSPPAAFPQAIYAERGRTDAAGIGRIEARVPAATQADAIDLDSARTLLGGEIHAIDAVAIDAVRRLGGNAVVLEQRVAPGVVVQLREEAEPAGRATVTTRTGPERLVGRVTDAANAAPLAGARVVLRGTKREARTNERGAFAMDSVPPGAHGLQAGMIGYEPYIVLAPVDSGRTTVVEVSLSQAAMTLSEVVVTGAARAAPGAHAAPAPDLVRRIGRVRISISGPLPPDSLSKLLAKLAPIR